MAYSDEDLVTAALIDDDEDEEQEDEDKKPQGSTPKADEPSGDKAPEKTDEDEDSEDDKKSDDDKSEDEDDASDKKDEDSEDKDKDDKKPEPKKDEDDPDKEERKTRRERREERKNFIESIKRDNAATQPQNLNSSDEPYNPLDYSKADQFDEEALEADRAKFGDKQFAEGSRLERFVANQERFWDNVALEHRVLTSDPKFSFLNDKLEDGTDNPNFDEDKALDLNEHYLQLVGYKETPVKNKQGQIVLDQKTGQPLVNRTVDRTDLSWEKYVKAEVSRMERWAEEARDEAADESRKNLDDQRKQGGIRPNGTARSSNRKFTPADIAKMSDEEFAKNEAAIDRQIEQELANGY